MSTGMNACTLRRPGGIWLTGGTPTRSHLLFGAPKRRRLRVERRVADLPAAAPSEEGEPAEAAAGDGPNMAGHAHGEVEIGDVLDDAPAGHERRVGEVAGQARPAIVDAPDVDAVLGQEHRQRMRAGEKGGAEVPDVARRHEERLAGVRGEAGLRFADQAMDADDVVRAVADARVERVLRHARGQRAARGAWPRLRGRGRGVVMLGEEKSRQRQRHRQKESSLDFHIARL